MTTAPALFRTLPTLLDRVPSSLAQLVLRFGLAGIFWSSGRTKIEGLLTISDDTYFLFEEEYQLPLLSAQLAAQLGTYAEHLFPILLVVGLATRLSALALFGMTLVIQIFVYPDALFATHLGWFALALAVATGGPGTLSLDHLLFRKRD
ncbi:DoxX family protein [Sandarakinorhabdus sp. AAP62]|uniref:DoxX family protein n=1 Tax=Sandarakinorhabdus sp. AAP62 TaxID=1248916 RepID=UPI0002D2A322|nr:DoxX family protein [Sandarakinorhabdus sp. AAP62]